MDKLISDRLESLQETLLAAYKASNELKRQTSVKGDEREIFVASFLREMFPPQFRFGSGVVIDQQENRTGQLDVVIELPFAPSFSLGRGSPRVYFADTVGAVIEVKSNLFQKDTEGRLQIEQQLKRRDGASQLVALKDVQRSVWLWKRVEDSSIAENEDATVTKDEWTIGEGNSIPAYIVGYTGPDLQELKDYVEQEQMHWKEDPRLEAWFRGILQIEGPFFVGSDGRSYSGPQALGAFINSLYFELNRVVWGHAQLWDYFKLESTIGQSE